jgi:mannose-1-phosphate guanylyltransferase/mannose-6-phosphate isomerase
VFPADHVINDLSRFHESLDTAIRLAGMNYIVTFGIRPNYPETGYGYIEGGKRIEGGALRIKKFVEKPDRKTAGEYLEAGNFFWNSGMFAFKASVMMKEFRLYEPSLLKEVRRIVSKDGPVSSEMYEKLPDISIDYAIMERTDRAVVLPSDFGWSDVGSWKSLYSLLPKDADRNVVEGDVILKDTKNCYIKGDERLVVVNGLKNIVVVETPDTVFVSALDKSANIKSIVTDLKKAGRKEYKAHTTVYRPWGTYTILEEKGNSKMKRIVIYPGAKLSLQMHYHRSEHWVVVQGTAKITNGDQTIFLEENQSTYIPKTTVHRLENPGKVPLHIIEVQIGDYLEEEDIVRFDDDFGRVEKRSRASKKKKA